MANVAGSTQILLHSALLRLRQARDLRHILGHVPDERELLGGAQQMDFPALDD
jgi:hypothetical protein